ncbi:MAG: hypothetical protein AAF702_09900 [Chloroflexota bacterium]
MRITNSGTTIVPAVPLTDVYPSAYLEYVSANPAPNPGPPNSVIYWDDVALCGGLGVGQSVAIVVNFTTLRDSTQLPNNAARNYASTAGSAEDTASVRIFTTTAATLAQAEAFRTGQDMTALDHDNVNECGWIQSLSGSGV